MDGRQGTAGREGVGLSVTSLQLCFDLGNTPMGLDIFHLKVLQQGAGGNDVFQIHENGENQSIFDKYRIFVEIVENQYIDWPENFQANGLNAGDFGMRSHSSSSQIFVGIVNQYDFVSISEFSDFNAKVKVSFIDKPPIFGFLKKKNTIYGNIKMMTVSEAVIKAEQVGYQRGHVTDEFYDLFTPAAGITNFEDLLKMYNSVVPDAKNHFKSEFFDKWDENRSCVVVSW
jgi:hypothetical protein